MTTRETIGQENLSKDMRDAFGALQCGIAKCRADGTWTVLLANDLFYEIIGYSPFEFKQKFNNRYCDLVYNADLAVLNLEVEKQMSVEGRYIGEYSIITAEGKVRDILEKTVPVTEDDGTRNFYCTFVDITDQTKAHRAVEKLQQQLLAAVNHADLYFWEVDVPKKILYSGYKTVRDFGVAAVMENFPDSFVGLGFFDLASEKEYIRIFKDIEAGKQNAEGLVKFKEEYGGNWYRIKMTNMYDAEGKPTTAFATAESVEEYKRLEDIFYTASEVQGICVWTVDLITKQGFQPEYMKKKYGYAGTIDNIEETMVKEGSIHPDDVEVYRNMYRRAYAGEKRTEARYRKFNRVTKTWDWFWVNYTTVFDSSKRPIRLICGATNINAQVDSEEKYLTFSNYRKLALKNTVASFKMNLTTNECDDGQSESSDVLVMNVDNTVDGLFSFAYKRFPSADDLEKYKTIFSRQRLIELFREGITSPSLEYRYNLFDDHPPVWLRATVEMMENPTTHDIEALLYAVNIHKEKMTELLIEKIVGIDYDFISLIDANTGRLSSYTKNEDVFNPQDGEDYEPRLKEVLESLMKGDALEESLQAMSLETIKKNLEKHETYSYTAAITDRGKERYKCWKYYYLDDNVRQNILFVRSDVTDSYGVQQKQRMVLQKALENAEAANAAKSNFLSRVSHDMRTPMNGILGLISLTKDEEISDEVRENLRKMEDSSLYLLRLINDTLDMNRIESNKIELNKTPTDGLKFVESVISSVKPSIEEKCIDFVFSHKRTGYEWINIDRVRIQQIFTNIVSNAVKFTPVGGRIEFVIEHILSDDNFITDKFIIRDTGIGMSSEFLSKIFLPFEQEHSGATSKYAGSGLGMAIVKNLVELMGGKIEVRSHKNKGTEVSVWLKFERAAKPVEKTENKEVVTDLSGYRILISEDHPLNAEIAKRLLISRKCEVEHAPDGQQCVNMFEKSEKGYYDLILMDIRMPVMDGLEATRAIRRSSHPDAKTIPIIAMTANAFDEDVRKSMEAGMNAHLAKPIAPQLLYEAISNQLSK